MTLASRLLGRWEIDAATRVAMPFDDGLALLNVRRIELACLLLLLTDILETLVGRRTLSIMLEIPVAMLFFAMAQSAKRTNPTVQWGATLAFVFSVLATTLWTTYVLSVEHHMVSGGYLLRVISLTMLFVVPPRLLGIVLWSSLLAFGIVVAQVPMPFTPQFQAFTNAAIVTVIAQVAGVLIHAVRRGDHEQKLLIAEQNRLLTDKNHELDQLMAIAAHDLRSPLYGLRNLFDLARRRSAQDPALPLRVLKDAGESLDSMLTLVSGLLDAHAAEHAPLAPSASEDLRPHLIEAAHRIAPLAQSARIAIETDLPHAPVEAIFDGAALARILDNLLANAVRYSPTDAPLRLACANAGGQAIVTVEDRGPGVDPAAVPFLFRKFGRRFGALENHRPGAGLGLFIAATYAERTGGALTYRAASPTGAAFELRLPTAGPAAR